MNEATWRKHKLSNTVQSLLLLGGMALLLGGLGFLLGGFQGVFWSLAGVILLLFLNPRVSPKLVLRMYRARPISYNEAPQLVRVVEALAQRAQLPAVPQLYYVPSSMINAFAVGARDNAAVACTEGMFRNLNMRELTAVLAHEISHVKHNDMWVMGLADLVSRITSVLSMVGQFLLIVNLPLALLTEDSLSWWVILLLIFAPTLSGLLQRALSRAREYDADLGAAELCGDPEGLARALHKLERYQGRFFEQVFLPGRKVPEPSLLRTHPPTQERIARLLELRGQPRLPSYALPRPLAPALKSISLSPNLFVMQRPHWHLSGLWY